MDETSSSRKAPRINRIEIGINVVIQTLLVLFIFGMLNYVGFNYYKRWDFSRNKMHQLSDKTKQVLNSLPGEVKVIVLLTGRSPFSGDIEELLKEVQYASGKKIEVTYVDRYTNLAAEQELQTKYNFRDVDDVVILDYKGKTKFLYPNDMGEMDRSDMFSAPRPVAFKGEQVLTSGLIEVTEEKERKLFLLTGHGELDLLKDERYSTLKVYVEREGIKLEALSLSDLAKIPENVGAILIAGARFDISEREAGLLKEYWNGKGRMFVLLNATADTPRLDELLAGFGIQPDKNQVMGLVQSREVIGTMILDKIVQGTYLSGSPVTKNLEKIASFLPPPVQSLTLRNEVTQIEGIKLVPLFETFKNYWGETDPQGDPDTTKYDDGRDKRAPLIVIAQAEKGAVGDQRVQLNSSRLIVVGNFTFIDSRVLGEENLNFFLASLNWLTNREELIAIAPKEYKLFTFNVSDENIRKVSTFVLVVMPFAAGFLGWIVWWRRRN